MIRLGCPRDVAALRWEWAKEWHGVLGSKPDEAFVDAVDRWMSGPRTVWTAYHAGDAVGMVCLTHFERMPSPAVLASGSWGYLGQLYVRATARGMGLGSALVGQVLAEAEKRAYSKVVLSPSEESVPLYLRCGFTDDHGMLIWRRSQT
ncbi:GNAT family N-acetyltransferase [Hoyosella rhizosphaerae]|uniref:N-acetyltransferase domain-containing protein n=1 Tax=Hoyosella rhizosphaerae TaxID=1755582 RepID=A0A916U2V3_9ACTN|nr:GNAT family N-acetyltransferase [Hoyosella rhizosphaerae]MBN4926747.1 GNAT family N-acetyltransferase [Hoyosella rhizosphaerae]GGC56799.1 hypothetical protein GCM10011410_06580 [Hoyosella rhizosphaerae]